MNSKSRSILILAIIGGAAVLALGVASLRPKVTVAEQTIVPPTFRSAVEYDENSLLLANGRSFITYNYRTGETKQLVPESSQAGLGTTENLSVSPGGKYLLFHTEAIAEPGSLLTALQQRGLDESSDYWWVYSVDSKMFLPLPAGTLIPKFNGGTLDALSTTDSGMSLITYNPENLSVITQHHIPGSTDFWKYQDGYLLQRPDNSIAFTTDGVATQTYYKNLSLLSVAGQIDRAVALATTTDTTQLVILNLKDHSQKVVADSIDGKPITSSSNQVLYQVGDNGEDSYLTYNLLTSEKSDWHFTGTAKNIVDKESLEIVNYINPGATLVTDRSGQTYLLGSGLYTLKNPSGYESSLTVGNEDITIAYNDETNSFQVDSNEELSPAIISLASQQIKKEGYAADIYPIERSDE